MDNFFNALNSAITHFFTNNTSVSQDFSPDIPSTSTVMNQSYDSQEVFSNFSEILDIGNSSQGNYSLFEEPWKEDMKNVLDYLLLLILILIMLAMGCEITLKNLWSHVRRPIGLSIGIISQFGIKPLAAYAVLLASGVSGLHATGTLIISCCPGGVLSNTFTYFCDGDLPLSVAMTTASTIMAMGMLPANIWIYGRSFESVDLVIPYQKMAMSLIVVTSPIALGLLIKWKLPRVARWTTKIGTYSGLTLMAGCSIIEAVIFPGMFTSVPLKLYAIIITLPILGLAVGYGVATLLRQSVPVRKTIAIECGVQNFPLALTVIALSFPVEMQADIVLLPWLYGFAMIVGCVILCIIYQTYKNYQGDDSTESDLKDGADEDEAEKEDLMNGNEPIIFLKQFKSNSICSTKSIHVVKI